MSVYKAITAVSLALSKEGISKDRKNEQQGYKFRGIDDVYNALAPLLASNGLCILPRVLSRECVERTSQKGTAIFYVTVHVEFDLVSADDNSRHTVAMYGEAMDTADKATNKAMSAAYKYMAMEVFAIPTEGDNDADATTHEVKPRNTPTQLKVDAFDSLSPEAQNQVVDMAQAVKDEIDAGNVERAYDIRLSYDLSDDQIQAAFFSQFNPKQTRLLRDEATKRKSK